MEPLYYIISKLRFWAFKTFFSITTLYKHERVSGVDFNKDMYANLYMQAILYREELEYVVKFVIRLKETLEKLINGDLEMFYDDEDGQRSVYEDIIFEFEEDTYSPIEHNLGLVEYIENNFKIDAALNAGFKYFHSEHIMKVSKDGEFSPVTQQDIFSEESKDDLLRIQTLNQLEYFRTTMVVAYEMFKAQKPPLEILNYLKEKGIIEA